VGEYLNGQIPEYLLELMQKLADVTLELVLDSGLAESGDTKT